MPLHIHNPLPSFEGITEWINGKPDVQALKGQPLLVYFWAISCHICHENMPKLEHLREKYVPLGLQMIAIHCPRMQTDTNIEKVKTSVKDFGMVEPCGIDNMHRVKKAFENDLWPAYFFFDKDSKLVRRSAGGAGLVMLEPALEKMVG